MLRRTKKDELKDIPDKQEKFIYMGLTKLQQDIYKNLIKSNNPFGEIDGLKFQMIYVQVKFMINKLILLFKLISIFNLHYTFNMVNFNMKI